MKLIMKLFQCLRFQEAAAMRQIVNHLKYQVSHSISLRVSLVIGVLAVAVALPWPGSSAKQAGFQRGDVFVSLGNGRVQRYSQVTGTLLQTLDTATGSFVTGSAFDRSSNFYVTAFASRTVIKFDSNGNRVGEFGSGYNGRPESIIFDADGNAFVGTVDGDNDVRKFTGAGAPIEQYDVGVERRGTDWIELAADKCTLYYTSEGARIMRYDVCTKTQLSDFVNNLPHSAAYALRLLPSGGLIVADTNEILRLDASGNIVQRYDAPGEDSWFAINLDPDGTSFWSGGISTGNVYKFDINSGNQITRIQTGAGAIFGLSVLGEITVVNPTPSPTATGTPTPTPTIPAGATDLSVTQGDGSGIVFEGTLANYSNPLRYQIGVNNRGPNVAQSVMLFNVLPPNTTLVSCLASNGGSCALDGRTLKLTFPEIGVGVTASAAVTLSVQCAGITTSVLTTSVSAMASNVDPDETNNATTASIQVAPPQPRVTVQGSPSGLDFGTVTLRREGVANPPSYAFSIENLGCLPLTAALAVQRTGSDVSNGRITNANDLATFPIALVGEGGQLTFLNADTPITVAGGGRGEFRIFFNPRIPTAAGKTSGLSANQAIPDLINSLLTISTNAGGEGGQSFSYPLTGRISTEVNLINPTATSLAPLIVAARNNDLYTVEFSVHDANMDFFCAVYSFLNEADVPVGDAPVFYFGDDVAKANMVRGQSFTVVKQFTGANNRPNVRRVKVTVFDNQGNLVDYSSAVGSQQGRVVNASAASFSTEGLAVESIVAAFGAKLATETVVATTAPLPVELAGTRVVITDSRNIERATPLFFVAPGQVNYVVPAGTAAGPAKVTIAAADGSVSVGDVTIADVAPALFTVAATGQGLPTGIVLRVKADGSQVYEPVALYDPVAKRFNPVAIEVGRAREQVFLSLFGTGFRYHRSPQAVRARVGGLEVPVYFAGKQGGLVGVDQINLLLPPQLAGRGEVEIQLIVDGKAANPVRIQIR
jgi:uncharacterized protein (TIGR03437 family)